MKRSNASLLGMKRRTQRQTVAEEHKTMRELIHGGYCLKSPSGAYVTSVVTEEPVGCGLYLTPESLYANRYDSQEEAQTVAALLASL